MKKRLKQSFILLIFISIAIYFYKTKVYQGEIDASGMNQYITLEKPNFISELTGLENLKLRVSIQNEISKNKIIQTLITDEIYEFSNKTMKRVKNEEKF